MQIYSFLFKWKKNCQPNFKKKVSLQFVRTVYVCSNQLVASFEEAKKNRMSQIENELETSRLLRDWYRIHKRELPWRESSDPYIIWISEIILQQTRVAQGMDYFLRFTERFPRMRGPFFVPVATGAGSDGLSLQFGVQHPSNGADSRNHSHRTGRGRRTGSQSRRGSRSS